MVQTLWFKATSLQTGGQPGNGDDVSLSHVPDGGERTSVFLRVPIAPVCPMTHPGVQRLTNSQVSTQFCGRGKPPMGPSNGVLG